MSCSPLRNSHFQEYLSLKYEIPVCATTYTYTSPLTINGTAQFYKRGVNLVTQLVTENSQQVLRLKNMTQGDPLVSPLPIKFAEIAVYNSANQIVQCGKTNEFGELKALDETSGLEIPKTAGNYTVRVFSRMSKTLSKVTATAAVKQDKYTNELYFISAVAESNGVDDPNVNLVAHARQTNSLAVEGGAFNILHSLYVAYKYIDDNTGPVSIDCLNDKLNIYWKIGFNPAQYYFPDQDPSSLQVATFYDPKIDSLFISGGRLGNITFEPTAHFDDFVVIHEFGHHVENKCGSLLSPGGSHSIIVRTDPRLAWAEGWANYLAAQVMFNSIDTINPEFKNKMVSTGVAQNTTSDLNSNWTYFFASEGFSDSVQNIGSGSGFMFDMKKSGFNPDTWQISDFFGQPFDKVDPTRYPGEGHFREGAVSRGLFKLSNICGGTCITALPISFETLWKAMDNITGIGTSLFPFKDSHAFMEKVKADGAVTWGDAKKLFNEAQTSEALHLFSDGTTFLSGGVSKWIPYATPLLSITGGACAITTFKIEPRSDDPVLTGTNSDQRFSNHFYLVDLNTLSGLEQIQVTFTPIAGTSLEFDLLLYDENYEFVGDYTCPKFNSNGSCSTSFQPSRGTNSTVVKSDRRSGALTTKVIKDLNLLPLTKTYLLNIRAYTANKSIASTTEYSYTIQDQTGANICP